MSMEEKQNSQTFLDFNQSILKPSTREQISEVIKESYKKSIPLEINGLNSKNKIGRNLMIKSHDYARSIKAKRIQLSTAIDNFIGQSLYESLGYIKDKDFYTYDFEI